VSTHSIDNPTEAIKSILATPVVSSTWATETSLAMILDSGVRCSTLMTMKLTCRLDDQGAGHVRSSSPCRPRLQGDWLRQGPCRHGLSSSADTAQIGFIGHSQGNGLAFISLSVGMCPELGRKLSCFIALAPAVYAGPLTHGFPFTVLNKMEWTRWKRFFGVLDFIPIMRWAYDYAPAKVFVSISLLLATLTVAGCSGLVSISATESGD
jgi:hypothetical protein